jgi:hypothetical protein
MLPQSDEPQRKPQVPTDSNRFCRTLAYPRQTEVVDTRRRYR